MWFEWFDTNCCIRLGGCAPAVAPAPPDGTVKFLEAIVTIEEVVGTEPALVVALVVSLVAPLLMLFT